MTIPPENLDAPAGSARSQAGDAGRLLAAEMQNLDKHERRFGYCVCGTGFVVPQGVQSEVVSNPVIHPLPWVTPCLRGMFNQRGNAVPVFDLSPLFDHEPEEKACAYMLITDSGERAAGLVVDGLPVVLTCEPSEMPQLDSLPPLIAHTVQATYSAAGQNWYEVDHQALFRSITQKVLD